MGGEEIAAKAAPTGGWVFIIFRHALSIVAGILPSIDV
jgi:hypothetical protein